MHLFLRLDIKKAGSQGPAFFCVFVFMLRDVIEASTQLSRVLPIEQ